MSPSRSLLGVLFTLLFCAQACFIPRERFEAPTPTEDDGGMDALDLDAARDVGRSVPEEDAGNDAGSDAPLAVDSNMPDSPACGGAGQMCCGGGACGPWLTCTDGGCRTCGAAGIACCPTGTACMDPGSGCLGGACLPCGSEGGPCCDGNECFGRLRCDAGQCIGSTGCATDGAACCIGAFGVSYCDGDFRCISRSCTPCGGRGQPCCASFPPCPGPSLCILDVCS